MFDLTFRYITFSSHRFQNRNLNFLFRWNLIPYKRSPATPPTAAALPRSSLFRSLQPLSPIMRGSTSLLVSSLSFVSLVTSGPLRPTHSSRFANNHISSRQFHYPRALVDVCADVDLSSILGGVLGLNHRSLLGDICLCLSAFPLDLTLDANLQPLVNLVGETGLETLLKTRVCHDLFLFVSRVLTVSFKGQGPRRPVYLS